MFKNLKLIFSPKNKDIRKRIGFTLMGLLIFALGTTIPVPGTKGAISSLGLWELYNAIGGGALKNFSIFALGVMPYISASIITEYYKWILFLTLLNLRKVENKEDKKLIK